MPTDSGCSPSRLAAGNADLIEEIVAYARQRHQLEPAGLTETFLRRYYAGAPREDLEARSLGDLAGAALAHLRLAEHRPHGARRLRTYNPSPGHGWQSEHTVIEVVADDRPFLVDSLRMGANSHGLTIHLVVHPVLSVRRDIEGRLAALPGEAGEGVSQESLVHLEVDRIADAHRLERLERELHAILDDVELVVRHWQPMLDQLWAVIGELHQQPQPMPEPQVAEVRQFLTWLTQGHFTFLGYREYQLNGSRLEPLPGTGLGILSQSERHAPDETPARLPPEARQLMQAPHLLLLTKSDHQATVHRRAYMDQVAVRRLDREGQVTAEHRFLGLYSSTAYTERPVHIPLLRRKVSAVMECAGLPPRGHSGKALLHILETLPRNELFEASVGELHELAMGMLQLQDRQRVRLFIRRDPYRRYLACLLYLPRDRYDTKTRRRIQQLLRETFRARAVDFSVSLSEPVLARLYLIVHASPVDLARYDVDEIESRLREVVRSWSDRLREHLLQTFGQSGSDQLYERYGDAFPAAYQEAFPASIGVRDIRHAERLGPDEPLEMALYRPSHDQPPLRLKLFRLAAPVELSVVLPILEHMGLSVTDEHPYAVNPGTGSAFWIHDIGMEHPRAQSLDLGILRPLFKAAFLRVWRGDMESDGYNRLVLSAGLSWRQVVVLRAYGRYLHQVAFPFSQAYIQSALDSQPAVTRDLGRWFELRFDPDRPGARESEADAAAARLKQDLDAIPSLDEDRILRRFYHLIGATLRTNRFQDRAWLSLKLDALRVPGLEQPRPAFEVFVYSPEVEGVHMRGGKVARGGIRWSDRPEDFRTEVFGLAKAQSAKNAIIAPVGAKGGFVLRHTPAPKQRPQAGLEAYRLFIRGLLDLTDNIVDARIHRPPRLVAYDDDDPYLVVAADKGTASFSDPANEIADDYRFWLGDAFASGGSTGYDHKAMGITARGAWESVRRHFQALDVDCDQEPISVVGIGDMGGDVFGNGMLRSPSIRLIAAFNHRHIFLDPNPDASRALAERRRLFDLGRGWDGYDRSTLSAGGGIYDRSAKRIHLASQAQAALGIEQAALTPDALIRAILAAPVDLLWNGGIGTFVKASHEAHADADDQANDPVRVDGRDLRCRVIGEGGNLGLTYAARAEFAGRGGRVNTDFIDNSGGVDCSDHEVNIKILLNEAIKAGELDRPERDTLLTAMREDVANLVLANSRQQADAISLSERWAAELIDEHTALLRTLERSGLVQRKVWSLPDDETLDDRRHRGVGLLRPELAVLLAHNKMALYQALLGSTICEDPHLGQQIREYFPDRVGERFAHLIPGHRLRREIIATHLANEIINRMGVTFPGRVAEHAGPRYADVARAYVIARRVFDLPSLWQGLERLATTLTAEHRLDCLNEIRRLVTRSSLRLIRNRGLPLDVAGALGDLEDGITRLYGHMPDLVDARERKLYDDRLHGHRNEGMPQGDAQRMATIPMLTAAPDIVEAANASGRPLEEVARSYYRIAEQLRLAWLREQIDALPRDQRWSRLARTTLREEVYDLHRGLLMAVLGHRDGDGLLQRWLADHEAAVERYLERVRVSSAAERLDTAVLTVVVHELRRLLDAASRGEATR